MQIDKYNVNIIDRQKLGSRGREQLRGAVSNITQVVKSFFVLVKVSKKLK